MVDKRGKKLVQAVRERKEGRVRELLGSGVDPNYVDGTGYMALHWAALHPNSLGVLMTLLASNRIDINKTNRVQRTALILAAGKGNYFAVQCLLEHDANVSKKDMWRKWNALDYAKHYGYENTVAILTKAGAKSTGNKLKRTNSISRGVAHEDTPETMLIKVLADPKVKITSVQLMNVVYESKITDMRLFLCANYLLHLLKKIGMPELTWLHRDEAKDYFLQNVYYRVSQLKLSKEEKSLANKAAKHAEDLQLLRPGKAVDVYQFLKVEAKIRFQREQLQKVTNEVLKNLLKLDNRVCKVEKMSSTASAQLMNLADNQSHIVKDMKRMRDYLNELHHALKKKERRDKYVGVARFLLSTIPIFGNVLGNAAYAAADVFFGLAWENVVDIGVDLGKGLISTKLGVDLSDKTSVSTLTSAPFLARLTEQSRERMRFVAKQSKFKGLENISRELEASL